MVISNPSLNTSSFLTPWTIFLISLIIVIGAIIILTVIERKLNKRILRKKEEEENFLQKSINVLKQTPLRPDKFLFSIDNISREFFEERYKINKNSKYSDLIVFFKKNKDIVTMRFCERMQEFLYGGEELNPQKLSLLLNNLEFLINSEKRREKEHIEKERLGKTSFSNVFIKNNQKEVVNKKESRKDIEDLEKPINFPKSSKKDFENYVENEGYSKPSIKKTR